MTCGREEEPDTYLGMVTVTVRPPSASGTAAIRASRLFPTEALATP